MEFRIKKLNEGVSKDGFEVVVTTMIGDADGYNYVKFGIFKENQIDLLEDLIETCERMEKLYPHGKCGKDGYEEVEGYGRWFFDEDEDVGDEWYEKVECLSEFYYPFDECGEYPDSFERYNVYYYKDGRKYDVEIIK